MSQTALMVALSSIILVQVIVMIALQRSRLKNKGARNVLKNYQKDLIDEIQERTKRLHQKNAELETAIHTQKNIAQQLQDTKRHLQTMINSVPDILVGISGDCKVTYWNTAAYEKTGLSFDKALSSPISSALPQLPLSEKELQIIIAQQQAYVSQRVQRIENDETHFYDLHVYPLQNASTTGAVVQMNDVTARVHLENLMIQNEKMSSLGELAAGIAHEINNPLGIMLHNTQNIIRRVSPELQTNQETAQRLGFDLNHLRDYLQEREILQLLQNIKDAGERASAIITNMLEFSRNSSNEKNWIDLRALVEQSIAFNKKLLVASDKDIGKIKILVDFSSNFPMVFASAAELQQVFLNLLQNACQALLSEDYKKPDELLIQITGYAKGNEVHIEIGDNGPGIKAAHLDHIFEPFFTTKEVGKGTGLGLSVSYFIVTEHHKGRISVSSQLGKGATFKISLPFVCEKNSHQKNNADLKIDAILKTEPNLKTEPVLKTDPALKVDPTLKIDPTINTESE